MKDTSSLDADNLLKAFDNYPEMLAYLAQSLATWSNVAGTASTANMGAELWGMNAQKIGDLACKLCVDLPAWIALPDIP